MCVMILTAEILWSCNTTRGSNRHMQFPNKSLDVARQVITQQKFDILLLEMAQS
jgi:predicted small secreted protein